MVTNSHPAVWVDRPEQLGHGSGVPILDVIGYVAEVVGDSNCIYVAAIGLGASLR